MASLDAELAEPCSITEKHEKADVKDTGDLKPVCNGHDPDLQENRNTDSLKKSIPENNSCNISNSMASSSPSSLNSNALSGMQIDVEDVNKNSSAVSLINTVSKVTVLEDAGRSESGEEKESSSDPQNESSKKRTSQRMRRHTQSFEELKGKPLPKTPETPKEKLPPIERPIVWLEGDLVWSLVTGHPLWPCMVSKDPESGVHTKMIGSGSKSVRAYHVQFFGDSPEHAWVRERNVFKFSDKSEYEDLVRTIAKSKTNKPPKVEVSKRFIVNWNASIAEVMTAVPLTKEERLLKFTFNYDRKYPRKVADLTFNEASKVYNVSEPESIATIEDGKEAKNLNKFKKNNIPLKPPQKLSSLQRAKQINKKHKTKHTNHSLSIDDTLESVIKSNLENEKKEKIVKLKERNLQGKNAKLKPNNKRYEPMIAKQNEKTSESSNNTKTPYECLYCPDIYFSLNEMRKHCKEKHPPDEVSVQLKIQQKEKDIASPKLTADNNKTSFPVQENDAVLACPICGMEFVNKRSLGQHRRFSHPDGAPAEMKFLLPVEKDKDSKLFTVSVASKTDNKSKNDSGSIPRSKSRLLLYSQAKKDPICVICEKNGDTLSCTSECFRSFHVQCLGDYEISDPFICKDCGQHTHSCIICRKVGTEGDGLGAIKRCAVPLCGRYFHTTCLQIHNLKQLPDSAEKSMGNISNIRCPSHSCATCDSKALLQATRKGENSFKTKSQIRSRLFKCIRCPTAYHIGDDCVAAGSIILGGLNIVCPKHFRPVKSIPHHHPVHISWCFVCSKGGELICCASCPAAFHAKCIDLDKTPEGDWHCMDCSCGIRPLYEDIVWVKLGTYRWWPGEVTHPNEVPENIERMQHGPGEFVVRFFGSNDYFWLSKFRVFLYQEGDNVATNKHCSRGISGVFKKALQEAEETFARITTERQQKEEEKTAKNDKKPAPYKHIKTNKPVGGVQIYSADLNEMAKCACKRTDPHACGPESECLNRMLMYECHSEVCPAGDRCENQRFQKCQYPETEVFKTDWGGWGLKSKVFIKKGSFVNEYVGELVDEDECRKRIENSHAQNVTNFYMLTIDKDRIIDAGPKGNYSRFMNHCCDPNCETQKWMVNGDTRVGLFAVKDIMPGEELTFNYNLDCLGNDKTKCMCGAANCSGFIGVRPKPQSQDGVKKERKKKRKSRKAEHIPQHDDFCFRCRQTGTLVCCDFKGCLRAFCLECLHIEKPPYGKWECPCHHCDWCGRRAQSFCSFCPNSFCGSHVQNQLRPSVPNGFDTCLDHNPETAEFEMAKVVATVNELVNSSYFDDENEIEITSSPEDLDSATSVASDAETNGQPAGKRVRPTLDCASQKGIPLREREWKNTVGQKRKRKSTNLKPEKRNKKAESD